MKTFYERLSEIGLPKKFVRDKGLPDWWDEEFEAHPGATIEAAAYVSRRFNLDIASLLKPEITPSFKRTEAKFKQRQNTSEQEQLSVAQSIASRVAEMVAYACLPRFQSPLSAELIHKEILEKYPYVSLKGLLELCWNYGIPVIHFNQYPSSKNNHKFDGMVGCFYERPAIIISLNNRSPAWLLFILAHELGHIVKGHVNNIPIVDKKIDLDDEDDEEIEANEFAVELLLGKPDMEYYTPRIFTGEKLAEYALNISSRDSVDPGVVVLNYAWNKVSRETDKERKNIFWATAKKALKFIEGDSADAPSEINNYSQSHLDLEKLDEDSQDYLKSVLME